MKRVLFVLAFIGLCNKGFSQTINPFKLDAIEWQEDQYSPDQYSMGSNQTFNFYRLCGDSLLNDTLYKKMYLGSVFYNSWEVPPPWLRPKTAPSYSFYCLFRQDTLTKSNYYRMPNSSDSLLCSYNFTIGDTLKKGEYAYDYYHWGVGVPTIKKIDSILIEGKNFKRYYTDTCGISGNFSNCNGKITYLIEGLGHSNGIFYWYINGIGEYSWNNIDSMAFSIDCNVMGSGIKTLQQNNIISIYPNPSTGNFVIETNAITKQTMQVFDINGRVVLSQTIQPTPNPSKEGNRITIDASTLANGIYNVSITSNESIINKRIIIAK